MFFRVLRNILLVLAAFAASVPASAEDAGRSIALELNRIEPAGEACRFSFLVRNSLETHIDDLAVEMVLFDADGLLERLFVVRFGQLDEGRSRVAQFDLADIACDGMTRLLVNGVAACDGAGLDTATCLKRLALSSRASIDFTL